MTLLGNPTIHSTFPTDTFSGDGTTTAFQLSTLPAGTTSIAVYVNGSKINAKDYYLATNVLTFVTAPPSGSFNIEVVHFGVRNLINTPADGTITISKLATDVLNPVINSFVGNGSTTFELSVAPPFPNSLMVTVNGTVNYSFTVAGKILTFLTAPAVGTDIKAVFRNFISGTSTVADGSVTTTKLASGLLVNINPGSVSLPAISVLDSVTTGIYSPSSNSLGISINGLAALVVDNTRNVILSGTGALKINSGTTAQRPITQTVGMTRFNTDTSELEVHNGSVFKDICWADGSNVSTAWTVANGGTGATTIAQAQTNLQVDPAGTAASTSFLTTLIFG